MKTKKFYITFLILLFLGISLSCSDEFLEQPAIGAYDGSALSDVDGVDALLVGIYGKLNGTNSGFAGMASTPWSALLGSIRGGEALVGTESGDGASWEPFSNWNIPSTVGFVPNVFQFWYNAISLCNQIIELIPTVDALTESEKEAKLGEARFLRAHYYFLLKRNWGNIPWIDETCGINVRVPNTDENGDFVNCWPQIEADMQYAIDHLPETQEEIARVNSWAAKAYMVKILMEQKKYDATAYNLVKDVINNGVTSSGEKYRLMPYYHDNFDPEQENNKEGVFQVQITVNALAFSGFGWFFMENQFNPENIWIGMQRPTSPGYGRGWGYYAPSQWFVDHFRVDPVNGLPYLDYYATDTDPVKNDYGLMSSEPFTPETKPLDPRLDWIVGRRGIPFLDWGVSPGTDWQRDATGLYGGPYHQKKWCYYEAYEGIHNQEGLCFTAINGHVIRFADVLLWAAELAVRVDNDLTTAANYVNQVRSRMQDTAGWVQNEEETGPAANYLIGLYPTFTSTEHALTAILFERTLELGLEGHRFYDVVRFGEEYIKKEFDDYVDFQKQYTRYLVNAAFERGKDELLPFAQSAIINSQVDGVPTLTQNPGY